MKTTQFETVNLMRKRIGLLLGARFVDRSRTERAEWVMARLRKRLTEKARGSDGTAVIRKFRDTR